MNDRQAKRVALASVHVMVARALDKYNGGGWSACVSYRPGDQVGDLVSVSHVMPGRPWPRTHQEELDRRVQATEPVLRKWTGFLFGYHGSDFKD